MCLGEKVKSDNGAGNSKEAPNICIPCDKNTYSDNEKIDLYSTSCKPNTECEKGDDESILIKTEDTTCKDCDENTFNPIKSLNKCTNKKVCEKGSKILTNGDDQNDRQCNFCKRFLQ